ncbi:cation-binding protein, partial [Candidatus Bathyarchaeota archaeon]|nr:cation-binding protein [Candidatus Bathyarchaeota archaeon]
MIIMVQPIGPLMWEHRLIEKIVPLIKKEANKIEKNNETDPALIDSTVDFF